MTIFQFFTIKLQTIKKIHAKKNTPKSSALSIKNIVALKNLSHFDLRENWYKARFEYPENHEN